MTSEEYSLTWKKYVHVLKGNGEEAKNLLKEMENAWKTFSKDDQDKIVKLLFEKINIVVVNLYGKHCIDTDDGHKLFLEISAALYQNKQVQVDFTGVSAITTSFLNPAIGPLYNVFPENQIETNLVFNGINDVDKELFELVKSKAKCYYAATHSQQKLLREIPVNIMEM